MRKRNLEWKNTVHLGDLMVLYEGDKMTTAEVASEFAKRLREVKDPELVEELEVYIDELEQCDKKDDFNYILVNIYDIGDVEKRLWIDTF